MNVKATAAFVILSLVSCVTCANAEPLKLAPAVYGDFAYYTLALTWQPGICSVDDAPLVGSKQPEYCAKDQPHVPLIGVHGLWPSRPQALIRANVRVQRWWSRGCDLLHHSAEAPVLSAQLRSEFAAAMPRLSSNLLTHEYDKHVQCFRFDPNSFFAVALAMRDAVAGTSLAPYLTNHAGHVVAQSSLLAVFRKGFHTTDARALRLQCARDGAGREVLTQLWITVRADALGIFPAAASLTHTPIDQNTCSPSFLVSSW
jgi:ribonuclease I